MKQLEKKDFLKFLQIISISLDKAEIKHEIPFCHIDKVEWNYINVIIPDFITEYDLIKMLNISFSKEKEGIIYTIIDDFDVRFIKTSDRLWSYTHYYYSWDILHILMNVLVKTFSLSYERTGLYYMYGNKKIKITTNLKDIFEFFELPFHMITIGIPTDYVMFSFIESSPFFESKLFNLETFQKYDSYYDNNLNYYNSFIKHKPDIEITKMEIKDQIGLLDAYFPKSDFFQKLTKIQLKEEFPQLKETDPIFKPNINTLLNNKEKEVINEKKKKKINLSKYFKKKSDTPDDIEYRLED